MYQKLLKIFNYLKAFEEPNLNNRIVNGFNATVGQFPWQVSLYGTVDNTSMLCGGSLISDIWVLTAGHCVYNVTSFTVGMGSIILNSPQISMVTTTSILHPLYDSVTLNYDIALIRLPSAVTFTSTIQAIPLPGRSEINNKFTGYKAAASGFGLTSDTSTVASQILQFTNLTVISNEACAQFYGTDVVIESTLCAFGYDYRNQSSCNGDSGGPLVTYQPGRGWIQIGVVSFITLHRCESGNPSGYIRTTSFLEWILENAGIAILV